MKVARACESSSARLFAMRLSYFKNTLIAEKYNVATCESVAY